MIAEIIKLEKPLTPAEVVSGMLDVDIILTDGFRAAGYPKIETMRAVISEEPVCQPEDLLAIVSDFEIDLGIPYFDLNDPKTILEWVIERLPLGDKVEKR